MRHSGAGYWWYWRKECEMMAAKSIPPHVRLDGNGREYVMRCARCDAEKRQPRAAGPDAWLAVWHAFERRHRHCKGLAVAAAPGVKP